MLNFCLPTGFCFDPFCFDPLLAGTEKQKRTKKPFILDEGFFKRKAATYSPTNCSTICAGGLNFSVRNGKR